jgi:preprotein translocase subunit SecA
VSLRQFFGKVLGNANERELRGMQPQVEAINALEASYEALSDEDLRSKTDEFLDRLRGGETLDDILVEAFALVREASKRTTGLRHFDVQLLGGIALHHGRILEMKTGEGKTLVATLPLYLNALTGRGVHLITVNDYLARRDVQWMGPIYHLLGLRVGLLQQGQDQSFIFDPEHNRSGEDYRQLRLVPRKRAYAAHVTYGTNSEFGFDYLRDNSARAIEDQVQRGFHYAIIDEVDNILIDEARTPLIISGPSSEAPDEYYLLAKVVRQLTPDDYEIEERTRSITLTDAGYDHVEQLLGQPLFDPDHPEEMSPQQSKLLHHLEQALKAQYVMQKNRQYIVQGRRVVIVDEFTGRTMQGRRWSDGLHQAVEAKENVPIQQENITYATITLQNFFRMYEKLSGMTGTAATEAEEFEKIYSLQVLILPTNRPVARDDHPDVVLRTEEGKFRAVVEDIVAMHCLGRPVLVGTTSVETSEHLSKRLENTLLRRWADVLLIRDRLNSRDVDNTTYKKGMSILSQPLESISASELRKLGSEVGISGRSGQGAQPGPAAQRAERAPPHRGSTDRRPRGRERRGDHRHQHGRPRRRHQAGRRGRRSDDRRGQPRAQPERHPSLWPVVRTDGGCPPRP